MVLETLRTLFVLPQVVKRIKRTFQRWRRQIGFPHRRRRGTNGGTRRSASVYRPGELAIGDSEFFIPRRPDIAETLARSYRGFDFRPTRADDGRFYNSAFGLVRHVHAPHFAFYYCLDGIMDFKRDQEKRRLWTSPVVRQCSSLNQRRPWTSLIGWRGPRRAVEAINRHRKRREWR